MGPKIPPHRWSLEELRAEWRIDGVPNYRFNVGLSWECPRHNRLHRLHVTLTNPFDDEGEHFMSGAVRAHALFEDLEPGSQQKNIGTLTLLHPSGDPELQFGMCGRMRVERGWVELVLNGS